MAVFSTTPSKFELFAEQLFFTNHHGKPLKISFYSYFSCSDWESISLIAHNERNRKTLIWLTKDQSRSERKLKGASWGWSERGWRVHDVSSVWKRGWTSPPPLRVWCGLQCYRLKSLSRLLTDDKILMMQLKINRNDSSLLST